MLCNLFEQLTVAKQLFWTWYFHRHATLLSCGLHPVFTLQKPSSQSAFSVWLGPFWEGNMRRRWASGRTGSVCTGRPQGMAHTLSLTSQTDLVHCGPRILVYALQVEKPALQNECEEVPLKLDTLRPSFCFFEEVWTGNSMTLGEVTTVTWWYRLEVVWT